MPTVIGRVSAQLEPGGTAARAGVALLSLGLGGL